MIMGVEKDRRVLAQFLDERSGDIRIEWGLANVDPEPESDLDGINGKCVSPGGSAKTLSLVHGVTGYDYRHPLNVHRAVVAFPAAARI